MKCSLQLTLSNTIMDDFCSFITFVIIIIKRNIKYFLLILVLFALKYIREKKVF